MRRTSIVLLLGLTITFVLVGVGLLGGDPEGSRLLQLDECSQPRPDPALLRGTDVDLRGVGTRDEPMAEEVPPTAGAAVPPAILVLDPDRTPVAGARVSYRPYEMEEALGATTDEHGVAHLEESASGSWCIVDVFTPRWALAHEAIWIVGRVEVRLKAGCEVWLASPCAPPDAPSVECSLFVGGMKLLVPFAGSRIRVGMFAGGTLRVINSAPYFPDHDLIVLPDKGEVEIQLRIADAEEPNVILLEAQQRTTSDSITVGCLSMPLDSQREALAIDGGHGWGVVVEPRMEYVFFARSTFGCAAGRFSHGAKEHQTEVEFEWSEGCRLVVLLPDKAITPLRSPELYLVPRSSTQVLSLHGPALPSESRQGTVFIGEPVAGPAAVRWPDAARREADRLCWDSLPEGWTAKVVVHTSEHGSLSGRLDLSGSTNELRLEAPHCVTITVDGAGLSAARLDVTIVRKRRRPGEVLRRRVFSVSLPRFRIASASGEPIELRVLTEGMRAEGRILDWAVSALDLSFEPRSLGKRYALVRTPLGDPVERATVGFALEDGRILTRSTDDAGRCDVLIADDVRCYASLAGWDYVSINKKQQLVAPGATATLIVERSATLGVRYFGSSQDLSIHVTSGDGKTARRRFYFLSNGVLPLVGLSPGPATVTIETLSAPPRRLYEESVVLSPDRPVWIEVSGD